MDLVFTLFDVLHPETCLFINRGSSTACIVVLPIILLCTPFLSQLDRFVVCSLWLQCETWVIAVLAGALLKLFFAWNVT